MEKYSPPFFKWIRVHQTQLIIAGISIMTIVGVVIGLRNERDIREVRAKLDNVNQRAPDANTLEFLGSEVFDSVHSATKTRRFYTIPRQSFDVRQHTRMLSKDRCHSAEKAAEAVALGINLLPNQTLVSSYTKYVA